MFHLTVAYYRDRGFAILIMQCRTIVELTFANVCIFALHLPTVLSQINSLKFCNRSAPQLLSWVALLPISMLPLQRVHLMVATDCIQMWIAPQLDAAQKRRSSIMASLREGDHQPATRAAPLVFGTTQSRPKTDSSCVALSVLTACRVACEGSTAAPQKPRFEPYPFVTGSAHACCLVSQSRGPLERHCRLTPGSPCLGRQEGMDT